MEFLDSRGQFREDVAHTRELESEMRQKFLTQRQTPIEEEIWDAWKKRQFGRMHQLRVAYTANACGPEKRKYIFARINLTVEE